MEHEFYWNTSITPERQQQIRDWIDTLSDEDLALMQEMVADVAKKTNTSSMMKQLG